MYVNGFGVSEPLLVINCGEPAEFGCKRDQDYSLYRQRFLTLDFDCKTCTDKILLNTHYSWFISDLEIRKYFAFFHPSVNIRDLMLCCVLHESVKSRVH